MFLMCCHYVFAQDRYIDINGKTIEQRFKAPDGYQRITLKKKTFAEYLRTLPLKPHGSVLKNYAAKTLHKEDVYIAIVDMDLDSRDLQQCADAVMRLKGEYLFKQNKKDQIAFRLVSSNKDVAFLSYSHGNQSYEAFRKYMRYIFAYANTYSLRNQLIPVKMAEMQVGDVFIQKAQNGKSYGHAVIVVDMVINDLGQKLYLLAQSYMPAQDTQILINKNQMSPWYVLDLNQDKIVTPEWTFMPSDLRRFKDDF